MVCIVRSPDTLTISLGCLTAHSYQDAFDRLAYRVPVWADEYGQKAEAQRQFDHAIQLLALGLKQVDA